MDKCIICGVIMNKATYESTPVGMCGFCCKTPKHIPDDQFVRYLVKLSEKVRNKK